MKHYFKNIFALSFFSLIILNPSFLNVDSNHISFFYPHPEEMESKIESSSFHNIENTRPIGDKIAIHSELNIYKTLKDNAKNIVKGDITDTTFTKLTISIETTFWKIQTFSVQPYPYIKVNATLINESNHGYFYVDDTLLSSYPIDVITAKVSYWSMFFELNIWNNMSECFGTINGSLGNIGDGKVIMFFTNMDSGIAGYFNPLNEHVSLYSNEWEMIYISWEHGDLGTISHELQHLIHYNFDQNEFWWVDEGFSELARTITNTLDFDELDNVTWLLRDFYINHPERSLLYWDYYNDYDYLEVDYGMSYLFALYCYDQYGMIFISSITKNINNGKTSFSEELEIFSTGLTFTDIWNSYCVASIINNKTTNCAYGFNSTNFKLLPKKDLTGINNYNGQGRIEIYGFYNIKIGDTSTPVNIEFTKGGSSRLTYMKVICYNHSNNELIVYSVTDKITFSNLNNSIYTFIVTCFDEDFDMVFEEQFGLAHYMDFFYKLSTSQITEYDKNDINLAVVFGILTDNDQYQISDTSFYIYNGSYLSDLQGTKGVDVIFSCNNYNHTYSLSFETYFSWHNYFNLSHVESGTYKVYLIPYFIDNDIKYHKELLIDIIIIKHQIIISRPVLTIIDDVFSILFSYFYIQSIPFEISLTLDYMVFKNNLSIINHTEHTTQTDTHEKITDIQHVPLGEGLYKIKIIITVNIDKVESYYSNEVKITTTAKSQVPFTTMIISTISLSIIALSKRAKRTKRYSIRI